MNRTEALRMLRDYGRAAAEQRYADAAELGIELVDALTATEQFEPMPDPSNDATGAFEPAYYWMHECGYVHAWSASQMAEQRASDAPGGCDACESGSDNLADWTPLYRPVKR